MQLCIRTSITKVSTITKRGEQRAGKCSSIRYREFESILWLRYDGSPQPAQPSVIFPSFKLDSLSSANPHWEAMPVVWVLDGFYDYSLKPTNIPREISLTDIRFSNTYARTLQDTRKLQKRLTDPRDNNPYQHHNSESTSSTTSLGDTILLRRHDTCRKPGHRSRCRIPQGTISYNLFRYSG